MCINKNNEQRAVLMILCKAYAYLIVIDGLQLKGVVVRDDLELKMIMKIGFDMSILEGLLCSSAFK